MLHKKVKFICIIDLPVVRDILLQRYYFDFDSSYLHAQKTLMQTEEHSRKLHKLKI